MHWEPDVGFDPGSPGSRPGSKAGAKPLRHPGIPQVPSLIAHPPIHLPSGHCCAQDCESEKPPRSQHRCKHTRVYLQARTWVQVYPTQRSRDLDPEVGYSWDFMGRSRGFSEEVEEFFHSDMGERVGEFLKICFHSNTGLSVSVRSVLSSVFILIRDSLSRALCVFPVKFQLLFTGACDGCTCVNAKLEVEWP